MSSSRKVSQHQNGSQVANLLNPVRGIRDAQLRRGEQPKDFSRRNVEAMREKERAMREQRMEQVCREEPAPFKLKQFSDVQAKVTKDDENLERRNEASGTFLKKGSGTQARANAGTTPRREEKIIRKEATPSSRDTLELAPRTSKDYISANSKAILAKNAENKVKAEAMKSQSARDKPLHEEYGRVPKYLQDRRIEQARKIQEQEERRAIGCPPGMILLSEDERLATLNGLRSNMREIETALQKFPLTATSIAQRNRKRELEAELEKLEDAIKIFDKEKVYVYE